MAHGVSAAVSLVLALSIFAGMQAFRTQLASSQLMTILGGFLGSNIFLFLITFVSNMEMEIFEQNFQTKLIPEVVGCLMASMFASAFVHRVCVTVCFLFSCGFLYFLNQLSDAKYKQAAQPAASAGVGKRKTK